MTEPPALSVVLACYNEAGILAPSFGEILETLKDSSARFEIVFVDDASRDATPEIIRSLIAAHPEQQLRAIFHERNQGRGASVSDGLRAARGEVMGYLDVDLEIHSRYIPSLVRAIRNGADVATVRRIYAFQVRSLDRYVLSRGYSWLVRRLLGTSLLDTETGYKFFRRATTSELLAAVESQGWFWDTEVMLRAERRGLRIVEIPGAYVRRYDKTSSVRSLRDSVGYFRQLLAFRRRLARGPA